MAISPSSVRLDHPTDRTICTQFMAHSHVLSNPSGEALEADNNAPMSEKRNCADLRTFPKRLVC